MSSGQRKLEIQKQAGSSRVYQRALVNYCVGEADRQNRGVRKRKVMCSEEGGGIVGEVRLG